MTRLFKSVADLPAGFWRWPHVDAASEWADRHSGELLVNVEFLDLFELLRVAMARPLVITSGYRTPAHNQVVSTTGANGPHTLARAADVRIYGRDAYRLVKVAIDLGFTGIGFEQQLDLTPARRYVHLDNLTPADGFPMRPNIWSY